MSKIKKYTESSQQERILMIIFSMIFSAFVVWLLAVNIFHGLPVTNKGKYLLYVFIETFKISDFRLLLAFVLPPILILILAIKMNAFRKDIYTGQKYKKFFRGTQLVSPEKLKSITTEKKDSKYQLTIAKIPIPFDVEFLHFLENGSTGTGKSVAIKEVVSCIQKRKQLYRDFNNKESDKNKHKQLDRIIAIDPNGDLYSIFADESKGDILINPFDDRTQGWNMFNEIRTDYDYDRFSFSIVPKTEGESEKWNSYARLLLRECMKYQRKISDNPSMRDVQYMATVLDDDTLKEMLAGTDAESMFVKGADKALGSARFTLADRLPAFNLMPDGGFSILQALQDDSNVGDIYITWRQDQVNALKPLITTFADIFINGILSLPPSKKRSLFVFLDELASMDAISSLTDGLEKGRKHGLKVFAGVQSIKQIEKIYGKNQSIILMSCFRNLIPLGGSSSDSETNEYMCKAIGKMEVEREKISKTSGSSKSESKEIVTSIEDVVLASEISSLPTLHLFIKFAGHFPVTRTKLEWEDFPIVNKGFIERKVQNNKDSELNENNILG